MEVETVIPQVETETQQESSLNEDPDGELEAERERRRRRAARFGLEYKEPGSTAIKASLDRPLQTSGYREVPKRNGFVTGFDIFSQEEAERREQRAKRFGTTQEVLEEKYRPLEGPEAEEEEAKKARAARFGIAYEPPKLVDEDLLEVRHDVPLDLVRRPEAVHLYGVDVMSTEDCMSYFGDYGPTHVEWIDDSSCNVVFADPASAQRAIVGLGRPLSPDLFPDSAGLDPGNIQNLPYLWHKGEDFVKQKVHVPLLFRMATEADVKPPRGKRFSRYLWTLPIQQAKKGLKRTERPMDVDEEEGPKRRGGRKRTLRKRAQLGLAEVEMGDAEGLEKGADVEAEKANEATAPRLDVPDLRNLLNKRKDERLFSAARAGIVPAFLLGPPAGAVGGDAEGEPTEPPPGAPESREESMEDASESEDDSSSDSGDDDSSSDDD